jgi:RNA polymerase sigma-70 factor (ECF subfamily)
MMDDIHLIQKILRGDQSAFRSLVERYQNYVFTITFKVLKSRELAEEVAQDVFIKVYRMLGSFEQRSKFSTWLYTIAYRAALDEARKKKYRTDSIEDDTNFLQIADQEGKSPTFNMMQDDLSQHLQKALKQLRPIDATIMSLFYLSEKNIQEISEITGLSISNIKTKLHRLREQLRIQLVNNLKTEAKDLI